MKTASFIAFLLLALLLLASTALARPPVEITPETPREKITNQLNRTIIAKFNVKDLSLQDAVAEIVKDAKEADPKSTPAPIVLDLGQPSKAVLTLSVSNIPEAELLRYVTELASPRAGTGESAAIANQQPLRYYVTDEGVTISDKPRPGVPGEQLLTRQYFVPADFFTGKVVSDAKCQEMLEKAGIGFPGGASATLEESGVPSVASILTVHDTLDNQKKTSALIDKRSAELARETGKVIAQLKKTILPKIDFNNDTLPDVAAAITKEAKRAEPDLAPVPLTLDRTAMFTAGPADPAANAPPPLVKLDIRVTLHAPKVSELDLLRLIGAQFAYLHISKDGVIFCGYGEDLERLLTWEYPAPAKLTDDEYLKAIRQSGVDFPDGCSVHYDSAKNILIVRALDYSLDRLEQILPSWKAAPPKPNPPKQ